MPPTTCAARDPGGVEAVERVEDGRAGAAEEADLLHEQHGCAPAGGGDGRRRAGGAGTDDEDVDRRQ